MPMTPMTKRTRVDLERDRREMMEEMENREALREHKVPGYFESELEKLSFFLRYEINKLTNSKNLFWNREL